MQRVTGPSGVEPASRLTRRAAAQWLAAAGGSALLLRAGAPRVPHHVLAQDDDDDSGRGRGRGRSRGRGGDDEDNSGPGNAEDRDDDAVLPAGPVPEGSIEVQIISDDAGGFVPGQLTVDPGQSITFVNLHDDEHTATGSAFDTGIIAPGQLATVTLDTPGRFAYACQIHPEMTGTIAVRDETGAVPETAATPPAAGDASVSIADLAYNPADIAVSTGQTVVWTNDDSVPHTVTSTDGLFDSGIFDPGASFSWTFEESGSFPYVCQLHPQMQGVVTVGAGSGAPSAAQVDAAAQEVPPDAAQTPVAGLQGVWLLEIRPEGATPFGNQHGLLEARPDGAVAAQFVRAADQAAPAMLLDSGFGTSAPNDTGTEITMSVLAVNAEGQFLALVNAIAQLEPAGDDASFQGIATLTWTSPGDAQPAQITAVVAGLRALPQP